VSYKEVDEDDSDQDDSSDRVTKQQLGSTGEDYDEAAEDQEDYEQGVYSFGLARVLGRVCLHALSRELTIWKLRTRRQEEEIIESE
jgi:hypothetical protein